MILYSKKILNLKIPSNMMGATSGAPMFMTYQLNRNMSKMLGATSGALGFMTYQLNLNMSNMMGATSGAPGFTKGYSMGFS
jgi:zinc transporter ZupT